jgi:tRNA (guanine-N7-)-methyltransferase
VAEPEILFPRRGIRSFVRREGRMTVAQARALSELLPRHTLDLDAANILAAWQRPAPLCLEIGTGNGENLLANARCNPDRNYLAVEVHRPGIGQLLLQVEAHGITNVRVSTEDILAVLGRLPEEGLQEVAIFFPDPWPKTRHHKRRLLRTPFFQLLRPRLARHGRVHIATDIEDYAESLLETLAGLPDWENLAGAGHRAPRPAWRCLTRFEARGVAAGRRIHNFVLARRESEPLSG